MQLTRFLTLSRVFECARFVVVDAAQQTLSYYGNDPKMTLVEYGITEAPKGTVPYHTVP